MSVMVKYRKVLHLMLGRASLEDRRSLYCGVLEKSLCRSSASSAAHFRAQSCQPASQPASHAQTRAHTNNRHKTASRVYTFHEWMHAIATQRHNGQKREDQRRSLVQGVGWCGEVLWQRARQDGLPRTEAGEALPPRCERHCCAASPVQGQCEAGSGGTGPVIRDSGGPGENVAYGHREVRVGGASRVQGRDAGLRKDEGGVLGLRDHHRIGDVPLSAEALVGAGR